MSGREISDVELFVTCLVDLVRPQAGIAAVAALEERGCRVHFSDQQTCCGQFAYNAGHVDQARAMALNFVQAFEGSTRPIVALSGSCAAMVVEAYPKLLRDVLSETAIDRIVSRIVELTQWLQSSDALEGAHEEPIRVAYHLGCHMRRLLRAEDSGQEVLRQQGYEVVELGDADQCCGFGGTFSMSEPELSTAMADAKIAALKEVRQQYGVTALVGADMGCLLHLAGRMIRNGDDFDVKYISEVLAGGSR